MKKLGLKFFVFSAIITFLESVVFQSFEYNFNDYYPILGLAAQSFGYGMPLWALTCIITYAVVAPKNITSLKEKLYYSSAISLFIMTILNLANYIN